MEPKKTKLDANVSAQENNLANNEPNQKEENPFRGQPFKGQKPMSLKDGIIELEARDKQAKENTLAAANGKEESAVVEPIAPDVEKNAISDAQKQMLELTELELEAACIKLFEQFEKTVKDEKQKQQLAEFRERINKLRKKEYMEQLDEWRQLYTDMSHSQLNPHHIRLTQQKNTRPSLVQKRSTKNMEDVRSKKETDKIEYFPHTLKDKKFRTWYDLDIEEINHINQYIDSYQIRIAFLLSRKPEKLLAKEYNQLLGMWDQIYAYYTAFDEQPLTRTDLFKNEESLKNKIEDCLVELQNGIDAYNNVDRSHGSIPFYSTYSEIVNVSDELRHAEKPLTLLEALKDDQHMRLNTTEYTVEGQTEKEKVTTANKIVDGGLRSEAYLPDGLNLDQLMDAAIRQIENFLAETDNKIDPIWIEGENLDEKGAIYLQYMLLYGAYLKKYESSRYIPFENHTKGMVQDPTDKEVEAFRSKLLANESGLFDAGIVAAARILKKDDKTSYTLKALEDHTPSLEKIISEGKKELIEANAKKGHQREGFFSKIRNCFSKNSGKENETLMDKFSREAEKMEKDNVQLKDNLALLQEAKHAEHVDDDKIKNVVSNINAHLSAYELPLALQEHLKQTNDPSLKKHYLAYLEHQQYKLSAKQEAVNKPLSILKNKIASLKEELEQEMKNEARLVV